MRRSRYRGHSRRPALTSPGRAERPSRGGSAARIRAALLPIGFPDRTETGRNLAGPGHRPGRRRGRLRIPAGGVPLGLEIARALASLLPAKRIFLSRPYRPIRHPFGNSPVRTVSCAIITPIHETSGLAICWIRDRTAAHAAPYPSRPLSARPSKMNCIARAHSNTPRIRVRTCTPVIPSQCWMRTATSRQTRASTMIASRAPSTTS